MTVRLPEEPTREEVTAELHRIRSLMPALLNPAVLHDSDAQDVVIVDALVARGFLRVGASLPDTDPETTE